MSKVRWSIATAGRDLVEIILVAAFVLLVPPLVEREMIQRGLEVTGASRILATGAIFIAWALFAALLVALNRESMSDVGLIRPKSWGRSILIGTSVAAILFAGVVTLEHLGIGRERLGDLITELKGDPVLVMERMSISVLVVGFVEEFIFRGFLMLRLTKLFGGSGLAVGVTLVLQAVLFGLAHSYQHGFGMLLTGVFGLVFGLVYLQTGRNLCTVVIAHGIYDAAHALYLSGLFGTPF